MWCKRSLICVAWLVVGCAPVAIDPTLSFTPTPGPPSPGDSLTLAPLNPPPTPETEDDEMQPTVSPPAGTQPLVDQAIADLAGRLSVQPSDVHLVTFEAVVWPDASLGCPQPGIAYIQVQREGYRIALQVGEQVYAYHGGAGRGPFLCEQPEQRTPAAGSMSQ